MKKILVFFTLLLSTQTTSCCSHTIFKAIIGQGETPHLDYFSEDLNEENMKQFVYNIIDKEISFPTMTKWLYSKTALIELAEESLCNRIEKIREYCPRPIYTADPLVGLLKKFYGLTREVNQDN